MRAEAKADVDLMMRHLAQVREGLIPPDSPPRFVLPDEVHRLINGLPWWFGPDFHPTEEALKALSGRTGTSRNEDDEASERNRH